MNFYTLSDLNYSSYYAYGYNHRKFGDFTYKYCEKCRILIEKNQLSDLHIEADKNRFGDFMLISPYNYLVTERVKNAFEKENVLGVGYRPVKIVKVRKKLKTVQELEIPQYYQLIWLKNEVKMLNHFKKIKDPCAVCGRGEDYEIDYPRGIEIDLKSWKGEHLFMLEEKRFGVKIASQKVVDICVANNFSNLMFFRAEYYSRFNEVYFDKKYISRKPEHLAYYLEKVEEIYRAVDQGVKDKEMYWDKDFAFSIFGKRTKD